MESPIDKGQEEAAPLMPIRRVHNYAYCPRLFYMQWVDGVFVPNADTVLGDTAHRRVDEPQTIPETAAFKDMGEIRSLSLSSEELGLSGVIDLVDFLTEGCRIIDYKKGNPRRNEQGDWSVKYNDAIQLAGYALLLRQHGIRALIGDVYYAEARRHVTVELTEDLLDEFRRVHKAARETAERGACPDPVCDSRCLSCSAYPVCLPFESRWWKARREEKNQLPPRAPMPPGDPGEILVVQQFGSQVRLSGGEIQVFLNGEQVAGIPTHQLCEVCLYGAIQITAQAQQMLMQEGIPLAWFSPAGRFIGMTQGVFCSGVDARMGQYALYRDSARRLYLASEIIRAKIHNQRVVLMRNGNANDADIKKLASLRDSCKLQPNLLSLRGVEGTAASIYFSNFSSMIKSRFSFDFNGRNRRPPRDPVNALLSMAYSILVKELTGVAHAVGLDPFLGFFHSPRYGRPALSLDMMEEFRPLIADSTVLSLLNRSEIAPGDFTNTSKGVFLSDTARRQFWRAWTRRMDTEITHPSFGYKMSYRRMLSVQMRQLWRFCRNEVPSYSGFTTR